MFDLETRAERGEKRELIRLCSFSFCTVPSVCCVCVGALNKLPCSSLVCWCLPILGTHTTFSALIIYVLSILLLICCSTNSELAGLLLWFTCTAAQSVISFYLLLLLLFLLSALCCKCCPVAAFCFSVGAETFACSTLLLLPLFFPGDCFWPVPVQMRLSIINLPLAFSLSLSLCLQCASSGWKG